ncbi:glutaredoxin family protein [Candidatus Parabeggiatoa sp. HSG14]|uniref:glutaredoxin family protein n=1 Tax=Candidatus Parabeggiatoa sp. HSG14 TaxID=3055593 RepID=UPI0025A73520|nr:glutaredoxin family protein [Thiotrichales bacterium HSG14]
MVVKPTLTLYTRVGCHLCEEMKLQLTPFQQEYGFSLNVVSIDTDSYLRLRYGERVPVLAAGEREICHYHLNKKLVLDYLKTF